MFLEVTRQSPEPFTFCTTETQSQEAFLQSQPSISLQTPLTAFSQATWHAPGAQKKSKYYTFWHQFNEKPGIDLPEHQLLPAVLAVAAGPVAARAGRLPGPAPEALAQHRGRLCASDGCQVS